MAQYFDVRVQNKRDTSENWNKNGTIIPLDGELVLVENPETGELRLKFGDGEKAFSDLPFYDELLKKVSSLAMSGATSAKDGAAGFVPAPGALDNRKFLRGDGTWAEIEGGTGGTSNTILVTWTEEDIK